MRKVYLYKNRSLVLEQQEFPENLLKIAVGLLPISERLNTECQLGEIDVLHRSEIDGSPYFTPRLAKFTGL